MQNFLRFGTYIPISLLIACGGGGGGGAAGGPPVAPNTQMSAMVAPAQWPVNVQAPVLVPVSSSALIDSTERGNIPSTTTTDEVFVQIWYLNKSGERVDVAMLSLYQLDQMSGPITLTTIPVGITVLKSEIYTVDYTTTPAQQLTLSTRDISL